MVEQHINPAKVFLRRYRAILWRQQSIIRALAALRDKQTDCTVKLSAIQVQGGGFVRDRMAEEVIRSMELEDQLLEAERKAAQALREVLEAIDAVADETLKAVLTLRYVEGLDWLTIQERMGYERTQTLVYHGRALLAVNKWLDKERTKTDMKM